MSSTRHFDERQHRPGRYEVVWHPGLLVWSGGLVTTTMRRHRMIDAPTFPIGTENFPSNPRH